MTLIESLALGMGTSEEEVASFLLNAPNRYKVYTIPKRKSGHRVIAQPSRELKKYQRKYLNLQRLPIHDAAMAYREGISIKENAEAHRKNPYLLKMDLEDFFNSISNDLFWKVWQSTIPLPLDEDKQTLEKLLFWCPSKTKGERLILSIGAPTSPLISNFFMYQFDCAISEICLRKNIVYTRYADDLTFSTKHKNILIELLLIVNESLVTFFGPSIRINRQKTKFSSKAHNRHVTGITITNGGRLSLGRERKRYIKHLVHQALLNRLDMESRSHLKGLIAFAKHIEPKFFQSLVLKHSAELMTQIEQEPND